MYYVEGFDYMYLYPPNLYPPNFCSVATLPVLWGGGRAAGHNMTIILYQQPAQRPARAPGMDSLPARRPPTLWRHHLASFCACLALAPLQGTEQLHATGEPALVPWLTEGGADLGRGMQRCVPCMQP
jgi:hypothetical protein